MTQLIHLQPGDHFRQPELGITGELIKINNCRAYVRLDAREKVRVSEDMELSIPGGDAVWPSSVDVELVSQKKGGE